jgi:hypothetical protein
LESAKTQSHYLQTPAALPQASGSLLEPFCWTFFFEYFRKKKKEKRRKKRKSGRKEGRRLGYTTALSGKRLGNAQEGKGRTPRGMAFPILHIHNHGKGGSPFANARPFPAVTGSFQSTTQEGIVFVCTSVVEPSTRVQATSFSFMRNGLRRH